MSGFGAGLCIFVWLDRNAAIRRAALYGICRSGGLFGKAAKNLTVKRRILYGI
jgi:hypothetical protein